MRHAELGEENCAIARTSAIVGERWIWVILRQAFNGARRFEEFQRGIGLARNVLAERLDRLVEQGILRRESYAPAAARELNEYRLTAKGLALFPAYAALMEWGNHWTDLPAPPVELFHKPCQHRTRVRVVCSECGTNIDARDTEPVIGPGIVMGGFAQNPNPPKRKTQNLSNSRRSSSRGAAPARLRPPPPGR